MGGSEPVDRRLLDPLREAEPPGSGTIDLARAMRTGRRRVRARRVMSAAAGVGAVVAVIVGGTALGRTALPPEPQPISRPAGFDVLTRMFTVGSAGGFTPDSYETGYDHQRVRLRLADPAKADTADALVEMYPRGRSPFAALSPSDGETAPPVNGRPAYWPSRPLLRSGAAEMVWEWAPGAWGVVSVKGARMDEDTAHRVAQSVLPITGDRVEVPFTLADGGPAGPLSGTVASYPQRAEPARVGLRYGDEREWVEVGVENAADAAKPNATVGGVPAVRTDTEVTLLRPGARYATYARMSRAGQLDAQRLGELAAAVRASP
ncbi:hypothetical protein [Nonomuraea sp. NPDC049028]|uniref:hypothetical protein n=1 Tax=Nonomuraea sp. NPDC049028 TaxID=3364348 RepID=UPI003716C078